MIPYEQYLIKNTFSSPNIPWKNNSNKIKKKKIKKLINKVYLVPSKATSSLYFGKLFILITIDLEMPKLKKNEIVNKRWNII